MTPCFAQPATEASLRVLMIPGVVSIAGMRHCATVPEGSDESPELDANELERLFMKLS